MNKKILVISDTHCGHKVGLTHPDWWYEFPKANPEQKKVCTIQRELWKWFSKTVDKIKKDGKIHHVFHMGDIVDGKGQRSGGTEQTTVDMAEQAEMGAAVLDHIGVKSVLLMAGTAYHTGQEEDWDAEVVGKVKKCAVSYHGQEWPEVNGVIFDLKHHLANSSIPHGVFTPLAKDKMWNNMWHLEHELQPRANVLIRGHVHRHRGCWESDWQAMSCDALCGFGSKYGVRRCSGLVGIGMMTIEISTKGDIHKCTYQAHLQHQKQGTLKL